MTTRIARRIPVAKTIIRADNPPEYVHHVAAAVEALGHPVEIAHCEWEDFGLYHRAAVELEQGLDLLWNNSRRSAGWHLATPSRSTRWRLGLTDPMYPDPSAVAGAAHHLLSGELATYGMTVTT